jgi:hypothetical protein
MAEPSRKLLTDEDIAGPDTSKERVRLGLPTGPVETNPNAGNVPQTPIDYEDVARSMAGKGTLGLAGAVLGTPGSAGQLFDLARDKALEYGVAKPAEYFGLLPQGKTAQDLIQSSKQLGEKVSPTTTAEQEGLVNKIFGVPFPTTEGVKEMTKKILPYTNYEAKTPEGEDVGELTEKGAGFAPGPGGPVKWLGRAASGAAASVPAKAFAETQGDAWTGPAGQVLIELLGSHTINSLGEGLRTILPSTSAQQKIVDSLAANKANWRMTPQQIEEAAANGTPVSVWDYADDNTKKMLMGYAGKSGNASDVVAGFNRERGSALQETQKRVSDFLADTSNGGFPVGVAPHADAANLSNKLFTDDVYALARSNPTAQNIPIHAFPTSVRNSNVFQDAVNDVTAYIQQNNLPIKYPERIQYQGGTAMTGGDLSFWDQVKRRMKSTEDGLARDDAWAAGNVAQNRKQLVDVLDTRVPDYARARGAAIEGYGAQTAPEMGIKAFDTSLSPASGNILKRADLEKQFDLMSTGQKELFTHGYLSALNNKIDTGNISSIADQFLRNQNAVETGRAILGVNQFDAIRGKILAENIRLKSGAASPKGEQSGFFAPSGAGTLVTVGGGMAAAAETLVNSFVQAQFVAPDFTTALIGAGATVAGKAALEARARSVAERMVPLAFSEKPTDAIRLSRLADQSPIAKEMLKSLTARTQSIEGATSEEEPQRAAGGRIGRATGGKIDVNPEREADMLMRRVEAAKKLENHNTERFLQKDDTVIAKALAKANKDI